MSDRTCNGMKQNSPMRIDYYIKGKLFIDRSDTKFSSIKPSSEFVGNVPAYILADKITLYPSSYEIIDSEYVVYSVISPEYNRRIVVNDEFLIDYQDYKEYTAYISFEQLEKLNNRGNPRSRNPDQNTVMGETAKQHIQPYIDANDIVVDSDIKWNWCHLIAFYFLPTEEAQVQENLVAGTEAFNGKMMDFEEAVRRFLKWTKSEIKLDVKVTILHDTSIAIRMTYEIEFIGLNESFKGYIDAFDTAKSNINDDSFFKRLILKYNNAG
ncbi:hypothetical protein HL669_21045 [Vibrio parahaemolyticus]|uniref:hypothetical protein n=1 Tax=Vibrio parahaemolyticus TaxID=670 RepID=UPI0014850DAE|nr:hypothetical protein [Vibrio parahaemolyticus]NNU14099.1 hypothetical protein [Vibrio parahaemolyticus]